TFVLEQQRQRFANVGLVVGEQNAMPVLRRSFHVGEKAPVILLWFGATPQATWSRTDNPLPSFVPQHYHRIHLRGSPGWRPAGNCRSRSQQYDHATVRNRIERR